MPRAKGLRGSKTKAAKGSKVAGRLAAFKTMPIDVLANVSTLQDCAIDCYLTIRQILSHVDPLTLIRFSRVSKAIREILLHPSGNHFWRDARVRVEIPKLKARDITDRQLLGLVYDKACHGRVSLSLDNIPVTLNLKVTVFNLGLPDDQCSGDVLGL